jgi:hypothetical protein
MDLFSVISMNQVTYINLRINKLLFLIFHIMMTIGIINCRNVVSFKGLHQLINIRQK